MFIPLSGFAAVFAACVSLSVRLPEGRPSAGGVAAARALGCHELYSEDMSHGREVEGVTIIDPFR
jgi:hypothetical protein